MIDPEEPFKYAEPKAKPTPTSGLEDALDNLGFRPHGYEW